MTLDALARQYDDAMAVARSRLAVLDHAADDLRGVVGYAVSSGGDVEARVDATGTLVALRLTAAVVRLPPEEVGALIVDTADAAADDVRRQRRRIMSVVVDQFGGGFAPIGDHAGRPVRICTGRQYAQGSGPYVG